MKVWAGYGSEHSYSLTLIGRFVDSSSAKRAEGQFRRLAEAAEAELPDYSWQKEDARFSAAMMELLEELKLYDLSRSDIDGFAYEHSMEVSENELRISTDEGDVQGFIKVLIDGGAKVEIYSSHHWTPDGKSKRGGSETDSAAGQKE